MRPCSSTVASFCATNNCDASHHMDKAGLPKLATIVSLQYYASLTYLRCRFGPKNTTARPAPYDVVAALETLLARADFAPMRMVRYENACATAP